MKSKVTNSKIPTKFEWGILVFLFAFLFVNFLFPDIILTTNHSISFYDLLSKNDLIHFYSENYIINGPLGTTYMTYDFPIFAIMGLWNIPLLLLQKIFGIVWYNNLISILYAKSILILFAILSLWIMKKILVLLNKTQEDIKWYKFLFVSSPIFLMVLGLFGGYDIISIFFSLVGIYYYLQDKDKQFVLFFALAISLKLFALVLFIPLLLLKYKKISKILLYGFLTLSVLIFAKLVYMNAPMYQESLNAFNDGMMTYLMTNNFAGSFSTVSIFFIIYTLICILCYFKEYKGKETLEKYTMYIGLVVMGSFCTFVTIHPQWFILVLPYLTYFLINNKKLKYHNLLVEMAYVSSMLAILVIHYTWVFCPTLLNRMLLNKLFPLNEIPTHMPLVARFNEFLPIISGVAIACFLVFLYLNYPDFQKKEIKQKFSRSLLWIRMGIILIPTLLMIIGYFR